MSIMNLKYYRSKFPFLKVVINSSPFFFEKDYNNYMFEKKFMVTSNDVDKNLEIRLSNLTRYMQQVATDHANLLNIGHKDLVKERQVWIIIRTLLKINRLPKMDEEFYVSTHPGKTKMFLYPRYFQVYDKDHNLLVNASSTWVIINYDTRKVVMHPLSDKTLPQEEFEGDIELPEKVLGDPNVLVETRKAQYSEVDMNGHINNTRYIDYVLDLHDSSFHEKYQIKSFLINFDKEIMEGEKVELFSNQSLSEVVQGKVNGQSSFLAKVEYEERK